MNRIKEMVWPVLHLLAAVATMNCSGANGPNTDGTGGGNSAMTCMSAADCPTPRNPCLVATCNMNVCDSEPVPSGADSAIQTPMDCNRVVCDADGQTSEIPDDADVPDDGLDCTVQACAMGIRTSSPAVAGTVCDDNGGQVCNANGKCVPINCGDGMKNGTEACDDGNMVDGDGCDSNCTITGCGNGIVTMGEICDDSNTMDCDGCRADCSADETGCGDGFTCGTETCDDANVINGDGCDVNCTITACGNGVQTTGEVCDDENTINGDGCSSTCAVEPNYQCTLEPPPAKCSLAETQCANGLDDDGDGMIDSADTDCALAASIPPCGAGETLYVFSSVDAPKAVLSESSNDSTISVTTGGTVQRAIVRLSIFHAYVTDVDVSLNSPTAASIDLSSDNGGDGIDYTSTVFDDGCAMSITDGTAPFTGCYFPEMPLSTFNGQSPDGVWVLHVADDAPLDDGTLLEWSLALCVSP